MQFRERAERERTQYNRGIRRARYSRRLAHCQAYSSELRLSGVRRYLQAAAGKDVLEIGSSTWKHWLEDQRIYPRSLHCINVSEAELDKGKRQARTTRIKPSFHIMDAHELHFPAESFDVVYGAGVLHHLAVARALQEIHRVTKPGGLILFTEPLGLNPIAKLIRHLTPAARTDDERPFGLREMRILQEYFDISLDAYQLFSLPLGLLSGLLFRRAENPLTYAAYRLDQGLQTVFPPIKLLYRKITIYGKKDRRCLKPSLLSNCRISRFAP